MADRPLFIGIGEHGITADNVTCLSNFNFAERRTIVWDPGTLVGELANTNAVTPGSVADNETAQAAMKYLDARRNAISISLAKIAAENFPS